MIANLQLVPTPDMMPGLSVRPSPVLEATVAGFDWTWGEPVDPPKWVLEFSDGVGGWIRQAELDGAARSYEMPPFSDPGTFRLFGSDALGNLQLTGMSNTAEWPA